MRLYHIAFVSDGLDATTPAAVGVVTPVMNDPATTAGFTVAALCAALALTTISVRADPGPSPQQILQEAKKLAQQPPVAEPASKKPPIDHSGRKQTGKASIYGHKFTGKKMADGHRFNPNDSMAASKSLPLGTVAKVTNLHTGKSTIVRVEDRGPYVRGRVMDVAPKVAAQLGFKEEGVAPVVIAPVAIPQPSGDVKPGAGAAEVPPRTAIQAIEEVKQTAPKPQQEAAR